MQWLSSLVAGLVGLAVGSFLNVVADRLPAGQSLFSPASHCPVCQKRLRAFDLIPVASYLLLRGRCRYCASPIPLRVFVVEGATGLFFFLVWAKYGATYQGVALLGYGCLFLAVSVTDWEHRLIPNWLVLPGLLAALGVASFWPSIGPARSALGAAVGFGSLVALDLLPGGVIGAGDAKLGALVGAATGFPYVAFALAIAFVSGGAVAGVLLLSGRYGRRDRLPFAPFLAIGAMVTLVWGEALLRWAIAHLWAL